MDEALTFSQTDHFTNKRGLNQSIVFCILSMRMAIMLGNMQL